MEFFGDEFAQPGAQSCKSAFDGADSERMTRCNGFE